MRILLDTQIFLWMVTGNARISHRMRSAIADTANEVFLSVASHWEVVIKYSSGKLSLPASPTVYLTKLRQVHEIASIPIDEGAMPFLEKLPRFHRDPFDRIIIAQAMQHGSQGATSRMG